MTEVIKLTASLVKPFEGLHKLLRGLVYPYTCPAGYWTRGFGVLCKKDTPPITPAQAEAELYDILPGYINEAVKACPRLLLEPPEVQAAIADFTFNLGASRLRASTLRRRINEGDWDAACDELRKWVNGGGRRLPGLVLRREAEIRLIRKAHP